MKKLMALTLVMVTLSACSFNVSMSHVDGGSTDAMTDDQTTDPVVTPTVTIPMSPASNLQVSK